LRDLTCEKGVRGRDTGEREMRTYIGMSLVGGKRERSEAGTKARV